MNTTRRQRRADKGSTARRVEVAATGGGGWSPFVSVSVAVLVLVAWLAWYVVGHRPATLDGAPAWSPDGTHVAFTAAQNGSREITTMNADGTGVKALGTGDRADEGAPSYSPDGGQIAFDADVNGNREIFVMSTGGMRRLPITSNPADDRSPCWSPNGRQIVFTSDRDSKPFFDLYLMNADGSAVERLTQAGNNVAPQFSPDGGHIAFHSGRDVYVLDLLDRKVRRLTNEHQGGDGLFPTWAPGGKRIAFTTARNGRMDLFVMEPDGRNQHQLLEMPTGSVIEPRWSPVDDRMLFVHVPEAMPRLDQRSGSARAIYLLEMATGKVTRLSR